MRSDPTKRGIAVALPSTESGMHGMARMGWSELRELLSHLHSTSSSTVVCSGQICVWNLRKWRKVHMENGKCWLLLRRERDAKAREQDASFQRAQPATFPIPHWGGADWDAGGVPVPCYLCCCADRAVSRLSRPRPGLDCSAAPPVLSGASPERSRGRVSPRHCSCKRDRFGLLAGVGFATETRGAHFIFPSFSLLQASPGHSGISPRRKPALLALFLLFRQTSPCNPGRGLPGSARSRRCCRGGSMPRLRASPAPPLAV